MEETRGVDGGGGGQKGGCGMWDEEDEANNDKKKQKNICILIWKQRGNCFFFSLSDLLSLALALSVISEFVILQFILFCVPFNSILV